MLDETYINEINEYFYFNENQEDFEIVDYKSDFLSEKDALIL